ncbi:MAG TPA: response regulator transcription factor [Anaerolineales bacterium]|jgi:DNA-binding response OmpR family regulator|nr:response regulator transcription factor [Anaerolineales bacterium]
MAIKILLVDDDALFRRSLSFHLEQAGYQVYTSANAEDALALARREQLNLILLDIGLPGMDGLTALRHFEEHVGVPVIFVTARRRELDEALGLELGADDYITKPFDKSVLLARIKTVLRRTQSTVPLLSRYEPLIIGDLVIDPTAHIVSVNKRPIDLSPIEFKLLHTLALEAGRVLSTYDLLSRVWGAEFVGQPQVVYVHLRRLRKKLEKNPSQPRRIITIRGVGYKLEPQESL